jgi:hypothetical protein
MCGIESYSAPTGRPAIAQGATLGIWPHRDKALKGRNLGRVFPYPRIPPRQGGISLHHDSPRRCLGLSHFAPLGWNLHVRTINEHLVNIFDERELKREATIRKFRVVRTEGKRKVAREIEHYNLNAILALAFYKVERQKREVIGRPNSGIHEEARAAIKHDLSARFIRRIIS